MTSYDLVVIGGGINGCGIARDAAGRGLSVALFEMRDLASGTSSASTKLIHGGLRYLEYYKFRLVRESLLEREVLWKIAPHIIWPLRFVLPYQAGLRPMWLIRLGLFLYDHIGGRKLLRATRTLDLTRSSAGKPLRPGMHYGFEYSDCWVDDSRLVVLTALSAAEHGARIATQARVVAAERRHGSWLLTVRHADGSEEAVGARMLVNAAGPWVADVLKTVGPVTSAAGIRLVQGSHIIVPRLFDHSRAYIFQNADNRIVFAIPYQRDFTLIGTTDRDWHDEPGKVAASAEEIAYLCAAASEYFLHAITPADVVATYSGVRPLYDDGASKAQEATRDYVLHLDEAEDAPLLSVFGGKITTYRRLAETALDRLGAYLPAEAQARRGWTGTAPLPGGDFAHDGYQHQVAALRRAYGFLPSALAQRLVRAYGTRASGLLGDSRSLADLGKHYGAGLYEKEVAYLMQHEWAKTTEDIIWRRTKLGLVLSSDEIAQLNQSVSLRKTASI
ncbi:MAG TPA: glycerol-3-phosphate dehydrogenase [Beijerinckiaceae bacterium]|nr:glycerol-3-phosphate dehydrogenase [Beijerinckiaceae bacterium]